MDFIDWVFDQHYIISTLAISPISFWYAVYKGAVIRAIVSGTISLGLGIWLNIALGTTFNSLEARIDELEDMIARLDSRDDR